ncbi:tyrosine-protein phosphatase non-receptor type substrate 1 [Protobothrops mucrosquamatus]|uniref:tyrosine-protein phosphatase non-receptor type substrate 1 n=1 Tax=Protobothrops mucrosquamatus TaxID=103944 RepID=UPI000775DFB2|nr:tyrosine-protein phosphatase non-receptor type substrate 1 [Protobothrops mucrosquamatus]
MVDNKTVPPKVRLETRPPSPVQLNATVTVTCHAESFYPDDAKVDLFCKSTSSKGKITATTLNSDGTYSRNSSMKFTATEKWNSTLFTCLVEHNSQEAIKATARLFIRTEIPPKVRLETRPPSPVQLNATVMVTCHAESFYPDGAKVDLFCKSTSGKGKITATTLNSDGTYSRNSSMKFTATEKWNSSLFTCLVKHNSKAAIKATARLFIRTESSQQQSMLGLYLGLFLNKIGLFFFFMGLFKIKVCGCCVARHFAPSSQG